jgi:crotonobetaine/carnitine-CoA ligase
VAQVAVFPVPSEFSEDEVMAAIVRRPGESLDEAEVIHHCEPSMAYFMVPRYIEFVDELPMTPTGKVEKYKLKDSAQARLSGLWDREKHGITLRR